MTPRGPALGHQVDLDPKVFAGQGVREKLAGSPDHGAASIDFEGADRCTEAGPAKQPSGSRTFVLGERENPGPWVIAGAHLDAEVRPALHRLSMPAYGTRTPPGCVSAGRGTFRRAVSQATCKI